MKRILFFILLTSGIIAIHAQKYEPNTKWPYIYENFTEGAIYYEGNQKASVSELNIHLWGNVLHYLGADGKVYQSNDQKIIRVEIGADAYIFSDHKLVKIIVAEGTDLLVLLTRANFDALNEGVGAYGANLNSAASRDLSSLDLGGLDTPELGKILQEKNEGRTIPLQEQYYFIIDGLQVEATKKGVEKFVGNTKADVLKQFLKEHKIKWKKDDSLRELLKFLQELK